MNITARRGHQQKVVLEFLVMAMISNNKKYLDCKGISNKNKYSEIKRNMYVKHDPREKSHYTKYIFQEEKTHSHYGQLRSRAIVSLKIGNTIDRDKRRKIIVVLI